MNIKQVKKKVHKGNLKIIKYEQNCDNQPPWQLALNLIVLCNVRSHLKMKFHE